MIIQESTEIINTLSHDQALSILRELADSDDELAQKIITIVIEEFNEANSEELGYTILDKLNALKVEEVWDRSGSTRHGFVEPSDAADEMIEEALAPFLAQLKRNQQLGMKDEAYRVCVGLLEGLNWFVYSSDSEFKNWAPDSFIDFAIGVADQWKKGSPNRAELAAFKAFVEEHMDEWKRYLL